MSGRVVEVEAYIGPTDTACHGRSGVTRRNQVLFGAPGQAYVYFAYGLHHLLNAVTEREGFPSAVLLRALVPEEGTAAMARRRGTARRAPRPNWLAGGPARLCQALDVDLSLDGEDLTRSESLFIEAGEPVQARHVATGPRVGIDYAARRDRDAPWRFFVRGSLCLSGS